MDKLPSSPSSESPWRHGIEWPALVWIAVLHGGVLLAPFFFEWSALGITLVLGWMTGSLGVGIGYHRLLTHRSFETHAPVRWFLAALGTLAGEGPPIMWVALHRKHHQFSDRDGDPHSPRDGFWWSHLTWMLARRPNPQWAAIFRRYAPDLNDDPVLRHLNRYFLVWQMAAAVALYTGGFAWGGWRLGTSYVVYGFFVRHVWVLHGTWLVNSATHRWGYRSHETRDDSRNLWWVALLTFGEGWHNNHHALPRAARHGQSWWEFDANYCTIRFLATLSLAWNVVSVERGVEESEPEEEDVETTVPLRRAA